MLDLNSCEPNAVTALGLNLLSTHRDKLGSFEEAARVCVQTIYDEFRQPDNQPEFALVRIYRLCAFAELLPELQSVASPDVSHWMALMGTVGLEGDWCDRRTSKGHKVLRAVGETSPMLRAAFEQIGIERMRAKHTSDPAPLPMWEASFLTHYFYVPQAVGSPFIPAQDFVEKYHIQSVVGLGSGFLSKAIYLALAFSTVHIDEQAAHKFAELSSYVSTLLALYDPHDGKGVVWDKSRQN